jgi:transaldolase
VTSNPSIFEKVISGSRYYDEAIRALALGGEGVKRIYWKPFPQQARLNA